MFPLTAHTVLAVFFVILSSGKSLPFAEAMHYVLYCSKVNTHTRIDVNMSVGMQEREKKKSPVTQFLR